MTTTCRGCDAALPAPFLDLGAMPLANAFIHPDDAARPEPRYPLAVSRCRACHLVQITETLSPAALFEDYIYRTSYSETMLLHARAMAAMLTERFGLGAGTPVVEIASNDGYLLQYFRQAGIPVLGVEPARNLAEAAARRGVPTLPRFFDPEIVDDVMGRVGRPRIIVGNNVLAHVPAPRPFLAAVAACLADDGVAVFEVPSLAALLDGRQFDTIYHEHVFYYSLLALVDLARPVGLEVFDVVPQPIHGGSLRVFLRRRGAAPSPPTPAVTAMLVEERAAGLADEARYETFAAEVTLIKEESLAVLGALKRAGRRLAAYGAPAKGNTFLNYCGIGRDLLDFTVDRSPQKQGLLTPGARLPVRSPAALLTEMPDDTVILPWNIADEVVGQQRAYLQRGGRFLVLVPKLQEIAA